MTAFNWKDTPARKNILRKGQDIFLGTAAAPKMTSSMVALTYYSALPSTRMPFLFETLVIHLFLQQESVQFTDMLQGSQGNSTGSAGPARKSKAIWVSGRTKQKVEKRKLMKKRGEKESRAQASKRTNSGNSALPLCIPFWHSLSRVPGSNQQSTLQT